MSAEHGLALSRQAGAAIYVETSAITNDSRSTNSAFEVLVLKICHPLSDPQKDHPDICNCMRSQKV